MITIVINLPSWAALVGVAGLSFALGAAAMLWAGYQEGKRLREEVGLDA